MEIPDLSLRTTFSPPYYKDQAKTSTCTMCKYTYAHLECGHRVDDVADTRGCPYYQDEERAHIPCDPDNPANRDRVSIKSEDRKGICNKCRRRQCELSELEAMSRDEERAKQQSLAEAKEREAAAEAHEERMYKESAHAYERQRQEREQADIEYMLQKSREEAALREQKEREDLARALKESCVLEPADRNVTVDKKITKDQEELKGGTLYRTRIDTTTITDTRQEQCIPTPLPPPVQLPSPPQTPVRAAPPVQSPPVEKPVDFSLPAMGQQAYGHYTIGGRRQPIHESQKQQAAKYLKSPVTPISPAPVVRLGSTVQPNSPSPRQAQSPGVQVPVGDLRSSLRRTGGPRQSLPSRTASSEDNELQAHLARRRTWEPKDETASNVSVTPSESASNIPSRASTPAASDLSRSIIDRDQDSIIDMDEKRKKDWRKD